MSTTKKTSAGAAVAAPGLASGYEAAGLCGAQHPSAGVFCTRRRGHAPRHANHYIGRQKLTDAVGLEW